MRFVKCKNQGELNVALKRGDVNEEIWLVGNDSFELSGSASVTASGSASVRAYASASVTAYDSASVTAYGSASVRAYASASVTASKYVAVTKHGGRTKVKGGVQINYKQPSDLTEWFDSYGIKPKRGRVVLFKAVDNNYVSSRGFAYKPGSTPIAPDWDGGKKECGGGLHFCAEPFLALQFNGDATKFVACPVRVKDISYNSDAVYPSKVKASGCCAPVYECDIDGNRTPAPEQGGASQ